MKQQSRGFVSFGGVVLFLLTVSFTATLAFTQVTGDSRWPGLNPTVPEPSFPSLCTQVVGTNGEPAGVLYANQTAGSLTTTTDTRIQNAINKCQPAQGAPAVGLELKSSGTYNAFVIAPITLQPGVTLIVDVDVIVFGSTANGSTALITPGPNTGSTVTQYNGGAMGYWGIMGYGIIDGQGSNWGWGGSGPRLIQLGSGSSSSADYFTLYKITLQNAGMMHVIGASNDLLVYDIKLSTAADSANTDGIDPTGSSNITIVNSFISDGDDHIAFNAESANIPNVTIAHNHLFAGHGISIGSYTTDGMQNMLVTDVAFDNNGIFGSNSKNALRIKSDSSRGGEVKNILYDGVCIQNGGHIFIFDPYYSSSTGTKYPNFHDITLQNVHVLNSDATGHNGASTLQGYLKSSVDYTLTVAMDNVVFDGYTATDFANEFPAVANPTVGNNAGVRNATLTLGPDPVTLNTVLDPYNGIDSITIADNTGGNSNAPYDCTSKYTYLAGELFGSASSVTPGGSINLTAIVQPIPASSWKAKPAYVAPAPTGAITIYDNGAQIASQTVTPPAVTYSCLGSGVTSKCSSVRSVTKIAITGIGGGTHVYTAAYSGDSYYLPSTLGSGITGVGGASGGELPVPPTFPSFTLQAGGGTASTTALSPSPANPVYGQPITFTANVAPTSGTGTPTGTVTFVVDGTPLGSAVTLVSGVATSAAISSLNYGTHTVTASYSGDSTFGASTGTDAALSVGQATPALNLTCTQVPYDGNAHSCTGTASGVGGATVAGTFSLNPASETNAGSYAITGTFTSGNSNYVSGGAATGTLTITQVTPVLSVTCTGGAYNGSAYACAGASTGVNGAAVNGTFAFSPGSEINAGSYPETGTFTSNDPNYVSGGTAAGTLIITQATPSLAISCPSITYDGNPHSCTATATGVAGAGSQSSQLHMLVQLAQAGTVNGTFSCVPASETNAGTYPVSCTFTSSDPNYASGGTIGGSLVITPATPVLTLACTEVPYDGNAHSCTGSVTGIGGATVAGSFSFSPANETNAGSYAVTGAFTSGNSNYVSGGTAMGTLTIDMASQSPAVSCPAPLTYDGNAHSCAITGGFGACTAAAVTNVPGSTTLALGCAGDSNHNPWSATGAITINAATPTLMLTCTEVAYDGNPHFCSGSATGVGGAAVSGSFSFNPASEINAGSYAVTGTFTSGNPNYVSGGTANGALTIDMANQSPSVSCPAPVTYDGNAHSCAITGGFGLCTSAVTTNVPGSSTLALTCAGDNNHNPWSANGSITINPAIPVLAMTCTEVTYDGNAHSCTGSATGVGAVAVAGSFSFNPASETNAGSYAVTGTFASGNSNYLSGGTVTGALKIDAVMPNLSLACNTVSANGNPQGCSPGGSATGIGGAGVGGSWSYTYNGSATAPSAPGTYTVVGTFTPSSTNYVSGGTATASFVIGAEPVIQVTLSCPAVTYDGSAHGCTATPNPAAATCTGLVSGTNAGNYPESVTCNESGYQAGTATGTLVISPAASVTTVTCNEVPYNGAAQSCTAAVIPVGSCTGLVPQTNAGSYTESVTCTPANTNYTPSSGSGTLKIDAAVPAITVACPTVTFDGNAHSCTATATGIGGVAVSGSFTFLPGSETAVGSYAESATFTSGNSNYTNGSASGTLVINAGSSGTPMLALSAAAVTFANPIMVGQSAPAQYVLITSTGSASLQVSSVTVGGANPGDFLVTNQAGTCTTGATLAYNAKCNLRVIFAPTALGSRSAILYINDNVTGSPQQVLVSGTAVTGAQLSLSATTLTFPATTVGATAATQYLTLKSTGYQPLVISQVVLSSGDFDLSDQAGTCTTAATTSLVPGASCNIRVKFHPTATGNRSATVVINNNTATSPLTVTLNGTGQ